MQLTRRSLLAAAGIGGLALLTGVAATQAPGYGSRRALSTTGTTLASVATRAQGSGYVRLFDGPGWPLVVRTELAPGSAGRDDTRTPLAAFVQLTDLHLVDAESPARLEYLHPLISPSHRPQEALGAAATISLVERINALATGPFTGIPLQFAMTTGDSTDNHELAEMRWFMTALSGGEIAQTTGDPGRHEGVQASADPLFWNPERALDGSAWSAKGFPEIPGLLAAAALTRTSPGLDIPWYSTFGNHDDTIVGCVTNLAGAERIYTGSRKVVARDGGDQARLRALMREGGSTTAEDLLATGTAIEVTPDDARRPFTHGEFVAAHLDDGGHGFTDENADGRDVHYAFALTEGITGISLDTTTDGGLSGGSLSETQFAWLERTLRAAGEDLVVIFSHHPSTGMENANPDSRRPGDRRVTGDEVVALLHRFPGVVAWINGHTHRNAVAPRRGPTGRESFWEITTASHIDFPQLARVIEIADNRDGTLSIFTTMIESDAPARASYDDLSPAGLASLYRELAANDLHADADRIGSAGDRNVELLLAHPFG